MFFCFVRICRLILTIVMKYAIPASKYGSGTQAPDTKSPDDLTKAMYNM